MNTTRDKVTMLVAGAVSIFVLLSLVFTFVLALRGESGTGDIWGKVFDLVSVLAGGLVGFIAGQHVAKPEAQVFNFDSGLIEGGADEDDDD